MKSLESETFVAAPQLTIANIASRARGKFSYFFFAQVLLLVLSPFLEKPGLPVLTLHLLAAAAFLTAVYALSEKRAEWTAALMLGVPASILNALAAFRPDYPITIMTVLATILFLAYTLVTLLRAVLRSQNVTLDTIYGAVSVYLLMAFVWGAAYVLLETIHPGALAINSMRNPDHQIDWSDCMFYSFVTLTTVGYGDMIPVLPQARLLSILEAVSGTMYVGILIARLVSLYSRPRQSLRASPD